MNGHLAPLGGVVKDVLAQEAHQILFGEAVHLLDFDLVAIEEVVARCDFAPVAQGAVAELFGLLQSAYGQRRFVTLKLVA